MPGYSKEDGNILKQFGAAVKAGRDGLGISQETLAEKAGLHRTYVGGVEQGRRNVSLLNIVKLSQALGVEAASVFEHMKTIKILKIINNNMLHRVMSMDNDKTKVIMELIVASLREGLGMSRYALAQEAGVDYSWLRRFEQGKSGIRVETLIGLAKGLGIPAGTLSARWRKRWKIPIRGLRSTSGKGSEGA